MKALVTGASGFTGSHLVRALEQQGNSVVGLVRQSSNLVRLKDCHLQLVYGDITDQNALRSAMNEVDTVFHTAAYVELGIVNEREMERVNLAGTQAVLEVAQSMGVSKVIYCSTVGVFGDTGGTQRSALSSSGGALVQAQVVDETFKRKQTDFSSAYDRTKYQAQQLVDQFAANGLFVVSLLPSGIFGPDDPHFGPVLQQFLKGRLRLWAGGDRTTGIVHVEDLAAAMLLAAEKGKSGEHYIISAGELTTRDMFEILSQETGIPAPHEAPQPLVRLVGNLLDPLGRALNVLTELPPATAMGKLNWQPPLSRERVHYIYDRCVRVDATKARQELGWQPRSVVETVRGMLTPTL